MQLRIIRKQVRNINTLFIKKDVFIIEQEYTALYPIYTGINNNPKSTFWGKPKFYEKFKMKKYYNSFESAKTFIDNIPIINKQIKDREELKRKKCEESITEFKIDNI